MGKLESGSKLPQSGVIEPSQKLNEPVVPLQPATPGSRSLPHPPRRSVGRSLLISTLLVATCAAAGTLGLTLALMAPLPGAVTPKEGQKLLGDMWRNGFRYRLTRPVNILVMGIDRVPGAPDGSQEVFAGRSDTMLLLHLDPDVQTVGMLSIPRDTQVEIPGLGTSKINQANASGGPALTRQVVSQTLNGIQIDRYVRVSTEAFRELVDLLGGVRVYVPEPMSYEDKTQKLKIDLAPGWQTLNGSQAEQFARFRHDAYGDIGRVQRQQALIKALREQLTSPTVLPRIPALIQVMQKYIDTNLSGEEMLSLINMGLRLDRENFRMVMLPGRFSTPDEYVASYWIMDPAGRDRVLREYFQADISNTTSDPLESTTSLRIAIQNASGKPEVARQVAAYLEGLGYTNLSLIEDWADSQTTTEIIVQKGDLTAANTLKQSLGFGTVEAASIGSLDADFTIRVGKDWLNRPAK